ncbi:AraC family transcriptional regulator [Streptomyces acidiscabies]|uniref:AraC family transcriptional regulator n=1 Tax=Streptomyces acidiscabies TaxID=42234 RepID=A0AAP6EG74_9ACTN|nr:AraC family transcriptional regulator [Streptomyces acidiscabies]MBP5938119.1 AraC family transcriptional regulator [Streptomyces sp. LBUM 1476]MBZ3909129.1 AraC family transcriptional regulator [Streptomyces acidiscabies]MDX2961668.1 AraC family transcriptional regulator [Streptomyces acidiscabies]MDX3016463.1 AraC family transcriptional regulator [Streptomyces acidiscabies]MDX3788631.1 AraC family transcriptional regulator [Streptomyces acidiscabies]
MLDRLAAAVGRHLVVPGGDTAVPHLMLSGVDEEGKSYDGLYEPMICFVVEGAKRVTSGDVTAIAGPGELLLTPLHLPAVVDLVKVPYRSAVLRLDAGTVTELLMELESYGDYEGYAEYARSAPQGIVSTAITPALVDAVTRWVELLDSPEDIGPLAARTESEILYRLLRTDLGPLLREAFLTDSATSRVRVAARWITERYDQPLSVEEIAAVAHMSAAGLHRHFKAVTGLTPLKYQKRLRMQEARRRLVSEGESAAQVAHAVGYSSATQFNREYRTEYGLPPGQDAARLRAEPGVYSAPGRVTP